MDLVGLPGWKASPRLRAKFRDFGGPEHAPRSPAGTHTCALVYTRAPCVCRSRVRGKKKPEWGVKVFRKTVKLIPIHTYSEAPLNTKRAALRKNDIEPSAFWARPDSWSCVSPFLGYFVPSRGHSIPSRGPCVPSRSDFVPSCGHLPVFRPLCAVSRALCLVSRLRSPVAAAFSHTVPSLGDLVPCFGHSVPYRGLLSRLAATLSRFATTSPCLVATCPVCRPL